MSGSLVTPWTVVNQAPLSMGYPRQEYWSGLPFPSPGDLPNPGNEPMTRAWQVNSLLLSHLGSPIYVRSNVKCTVLAPLNSGKQAGPEKSFMFTLH